MSQMLKSSSALGAATLTSRVLGMVREMAYAHFMGVGWVADAFQLAFMVPNLFRRLLGEGALSAAFIPIFKEKEKLSGEKEMWDAANAVISGLAAATSILVVVAICGISVLLSWDLRTSQVLHLTGVFGALFPYVAAGSALTLIWVWWRSGEAPAEPRFLKLLAGVATVGSL